MKIKLSRREMIQALCGGLGMFGLAGAFAGLSRATFTPRASATTPARRCRRRRSTSS